MKNLPMIKVYEIDFDFIIKNYTDKELWQKEWTLFVFKKYIFKINIDRILAKQNCIVFEISLDSDLAMWSHKKTNELYYYIDNMDIKFLKQRIQSKMLELIRDLENEYIEHYDETYLKIEDGRYNELEMLKEIASDFLDENGVTNSEIREAYIDRYVDENERTWQMLRDIKEEKIYTYLTDLWLVLAEINDNQELKQKIRNKQDKDITEMEQEILEYIENMNKEENIEELKGNLEAI